MALRPILIDKRSPFIEENCALCKEPFQLGEEIIVCPEDATRHHVACWRANGYRCTAYGCTGYGRPVQRRHTTEVAVEEQANERRQRQLAIERERNGTGRRNRSKVRTMPSSSFGCAQGCLIIAIALAIVVLSVSCFGLWAIADYVMMQMLGWEYREPMSLVLMAMA